MTASLCHKNQKNQKHQLNWRQPVCLCEPMELRLMCWLTPSKILQSRHKTKFNSAEASWFCRSTITSALLEGNPQFIGEDGIILSLVTKLTVLAPCVGSQFGFQKCPLEQCIRRWHSENSLWFLLWKHPVQARTFKFWSCWTSCSVKESNSFLPSHFLLHSGFLDFSQGISLKQSISVKRWKTCEIFTAGDFPVGLLH